jgi:hypothetical protein
MCPQLVGNRTPLLTVEPQQTTEEGQVVFEFAITHGKIPRTQEPKFQLRLSPFGSFGSLIFNPLLV